MKIIIPMAGTGARFIAEGYADPKPLIPLVDGRRIIEHVLDMFQEPDDDIVFVCNRDHLRDTKMRKVILDLSPHAQIVPIDAHKKGPVFTTVPAFPLIEQNEEVIISYCDGTMPLPRKKLLEHVHGNKLDGCLITHTGFHPHTLSLTTKMAFLKEENGLVSEIQEKASYTNDPASEHASSGVYYFARGEYVLKYFNEQLAVGDSFNGEFYITLVYNLMIRDGLRVGHFDTDHVAILGTPDEVRNFEAWATILRGSQIRNEEDLLHCYRYWKGYKHK